MNEDTIKIIYGFMFRPKIERRGETSVYVERIKNYTINDNGVSFVIHLKYGLDIPCHLKITGL